MNDRPLFQPTNSPYVTVVYLQLCQGAGEGGLGLQSRYPCGITMGDGAECVTMVMGAACFYRLGTQHCLAWRDTLYTLLAAVSVCASAQRSLTDRTLDLEKHLMLNVCVRLCVCMSPYVCSLRIGRLKGLPSLQKSRFLCSLLHPRPSQNSSLTASRLTAMWASRSTSNIATAVLNLFIFVQNRYK